MKKPNYNKMKGTKPNDVKTRRFQTCLFHLMEYTSLRNKT